MTTVHEISRCRQSWPFILPASRNDRGAIPVIYKFVIIISFLPIITASGCSDEPVSGSVDVASTNLEANFETPPRDRARGPSQVALRQQLRKKGWMVYPLVPELGLGEGLGVSPTGGQHFGDQDLLLVKKIENVRLITLFD